VIDGAHAPERTKAPYQIAVTVCEECKRGWQDGGGLTVEMTPPGVEAAQCDAQYIGSVEPLAAQTVDRPGVADIDEMTPCESERVESRRGKVEARTTKSRCDEIEPRDLGVRPGESEAGRAGSRPREPRAERKSERAKQAIPPA
jgi:hypothetical protein